MNLIESAGILCYTQIRSIEQTSTAHFLYHPYNLEQQQHSTKMTTAIANTASKIIKMSQGLRERYLAEMDKREGKKKSELAVEVGRLTQEQEEQVSFAALIQKEVIEGWTGADSQGGCINYIADTSNIK